MVDSDYIKQLEERLKHVETGLAHLERNFGDLMTMLMRDKRLAEAVLQTKSSR